MAASAGLCRSRLPRAADLDLPLSCRSDVKRPLGKELFGVLPQSHVLFCMLTQVCLVSHFSYFGCSMDQ